MLFTFYFIYLYGRINNKNNLLSDNYMNHNVYKGTFSDNIYMRRHGDFGWAGYGVW